MSLWKRLFGKSDCEPKRPLRDIPEGALTSVQMLSCDPGATDPERRFCVGSWGLTVTGDEESHRYARGVLKRSAGKTLRLEPHAEVGHRGVISSVQGSQQGSGYKWIYVEVNLRAGTIGFRQGDSTDLAPE